MFTYFFVSYPSFLFFREITWYCMNSIELVEMDICWLSAEGARRLMVGHPLSHMQSP